MCKQTEQSETKRLACCVLRQRPSSRAILEKKQETTCDDVLFLPCPSCSAGSGELASLRSAERQFFRPLLEAVNRSSRNAATVRQFAWRRGLRSKCYT